MGLAEYFLYPQIHWGSKSGSIQAIKEAINIGYDAIAFIDDQAFERDEVRHVHPDVNTYDVDILERLLDDAAFQPRFITDESAQRRHLYRAEEVRKGAEARFDNNNAFLESLEMRFKVQPATVEDLRRVEELTLRTNQLNATGYTYTYDELCELLQSPRHQLYVAELVDKYGTYGKVGVALIEMEGDAWTIRLLLMSCRVLSRGVGSVLLQFLMQHAKASGARLLAEFKHTDRNRQMYVTYKFAGFSTVEKDDAGGELLGHSLEGLREYPEHIGLELRACAQ